MRPEFKKYPDIENSYQEKFLEKTADFVPDLADMYYGVFEKIHGCNVQIVVTPDNEMFLARRKDWLKEDEKFYGLQAFMKEENIQPVVDALFKLAILKNTHVSAFGEFYGPGINKGVNYGSGKFLRLFDIRVGEHELMSPVDFLAFMTKNELNEFTVPLVAVISGLKNALEVDVDNFITTLGPQDPDNHAEGVVIKPFGVIVRAGNGKLFYLKKKHPKFKDKASKPKIRKKLEDHIVYFKELFKGYVNDNRLQSVISQEGPIEDIKQMGKYIKLLIEDARADFLKDHGDELIGVDKGELKQIFNLGSYPAMLIKVYL